ncbi:MAG: phosphodiesterase [Clostridia bacterium]|nr:phosphodiesterase [Clostridia bacterium]
MKFLVASDIHGDATWCQKVIDKFNEEKADRLVLLGDILYHGPRNDLPASYAPKKVIDLLNAMSDKILAVRGNCDTEVDQMVLKFPIMADYAYIVSGDVTVFATHGHHVNPANPPMLPSNSVLLCGHTHVAKDEMMDGFRYMNPGSPSIPKENTMPSYIIIEDGVLTLKQF